MDSLKRFSFLMNKHSDKLDRILIDYWASSDVDNRLCKYYKLENKEELLDLLEYRGYYKTVVKFPLSNAQTIDDIESYDHWPNPDWLDYSVIEEQCDIVHEKKRVVMFMGDRLNRIAQLKPLMYLRGIEKGPSDLGRKNFSIFDAVLKKNCKFL